MFWVELDGTDGGLGEYVTLPFPSEAAFDAAIDWCNRTPKKEQITYCSKALWPRRLDLDDPRDSSMLVPYWADLLMGVYAWQQADSKMTEVLGLIHADARQSLSEPVQPLAIPK